jgi:hypothetical protein
MAIRKRFLLRNPHAIFFTHWIREFFASSIAVDTRAMIALRTPLRYLRSILPTFFTGSKRQRAIHPSNRASEQDRIFVQREQLDPRHLKRD